MAFTSYPSAKNETGGHSQSLGEFVNNTQSHFLLRLNCRPFTNVMGVYECSQTHIRREVGANAVA